MRSSTLSSRPTRPNACSTPSSTADAGSAKRWAAERLARAGVEASAREAVLLLAHAARRDAAWAWGADGRDALDDEVRRRYARFVEARVRRVPFAHVVGRAGFERWDLRVNAAVLVPRPETELLLEVLAQRLGDERPRRLADLGTGSGALALALARRYPTAAVWAVDRSPAALAQAAANAWWGGAEPADSGLAERVRFLCGDWWGAFGDSGSTYGAPPHRDTSDAWTTHGALPLDAVVCNPPYLAESEWAVAPPEVRAEPRTALVAGPTGLEAYRRIVAGAKGRLRPGGLLAFEVGAAQADAVTELLERAGFGGVERAHDLAGHARVVSGFASADRGARTSSGPAGGLRPGAGRRGKGGGHDDSQN